MSKYFDKSDDRYITAQQKYTQIASVALWSATQKQNADTFKTLEEELRKAIAQDVLEGITAGDAKAAELQGVMPDIVNLPEGSLVMANVVGELIAFISAQSKMDYLETTGKLDFRGTKPPER